MGFFFQAHISSQNSELSSAALQALGFCVFNSSISSQLSGKQTNFSVDAGNVCVRITILYVFVGIYFNFDKVYCYQVARWFCL